MKYVANPVIVNAFKISSVVQYDIAGNMELLLENGSKVVATAAMTSRVFPKKGDYWVQQEDGYVYLNPAEVFERKYSPLSE